MQWKQVILLNASGATGIDQTNAEPSGPWEVKQADETGNLCDSDCADCRTAHGLEVESNRLENTDKAPDAV